MTKCYDIDPITTMTAHERAEAQLGLDMRATRVLRDITMSEGLHGKESEQAQYAWQILGTIVNSYRKVCGDDSFWEAWLDSFSDNDRARLVHSRQFAPD